MRLVCLHGFTGAPDSWNAVLDHLPPDVEAICPPIVGHDPGIPLTRESFEEEVDRLAATLPRSSSPFHLAGYSLGGRLALGLLVRHRELFKSATLIGVHPGLATEAKRRERVSADEKLARKLERKGLEWFVDHWQSLPLFATQSVLPHEVLEAQRRLRLSHSVAGLAHALRVLSLGRMPSYRTQLERLDLPICWMVGERDEKFRRVGEEMALSLPQAAISVVPMAGHNLLLESPTVVATRTLKGGKVSRGLV